MSHTQEQLRVRDAGPDQGWQIIGPEDDEGTYEIKGYCWHRDDAILYAAAPELLEACKKARNAFHATDLQVGTCEAMDALEAAIAKATTGGAECNTTTTPEP